MHIRGQAALEFLMTYGWAILVVLAAIGALAYFGVLKPDAFLPEKCTMAPGLDCRDFLIKSTTARLDFRNALGKDIQITALAVGPSCNQTLSTPVDIENGDLGSVIVGTSTPCANGNPNAKFKEGIVVTYTDIETNISKIMTGSIIAKIQP